MASKAFVGVFAAMGLVLLFACSAQPKPAEHASGKSTEPKVPELVKALPEGHKVGPSTKVDGAEIYAIVAAGAPAETDFLTLDEAMAQKLCTVREMGEGGTVNTLLISNSGAKPIFCMAGDLVLGGQQDRVLAESLVVAPNSKDQNIPVFCVEHGRWAVQAKDGENAEKRCFSNSAEKGQVDLNVKKAALESRDQGTVWKEVARNNEKLAITGQTESGTFRATFDDATIQKKIESNFAEAKKLVGKNVVGFAVMVKGELVAMDIFDSSGLCAKLSEKLLRSYVITGIGGGYESSAEPTVTNSINTDRRYTSERQDTELRLQDSEGENRTTTVTGGLRAIRSRNSENVESMAVPTGPVATAVNTNTETKRVYDKQAVKYECEDKTTGKVVQRSYMKR